MSRERVWVLGVGGPAGYNVASAAKAAGYRVVGVDSSPEHLYHASDACDRVLLDCEIDFDDLSTGEVVIPQPDAIVREVAYMRAMTNRVNYHGPSLATLRVLQDKQAACERWADDGLRRSRPLLIGPELPDYLNLARDRFGDRFWLRARGGAGARGAILVEDLRAAYHWIRLHEVAGKGTDFIAEEYLPGRDFCWTAVYHEGERMASFSRERLEWLYPHLAPFSGRTGTPTHSRVVHDPLVTHVGEQSVSIVDKDPHGVYCVDMREDELGVPRPTEINAGRWATTSPLYRAFGANLVAHHIRLAQDDRVDDLGDDIYPHGAELFRHIDMGTATA